MLSHALATQKGVYARLPEVVRSLTDSRSLLAIPARAVCVEHPDCLIKATVELRAIRSETQRMGCRQLVQVIVGSKGCTEVTTESIPYVHWVVTATASNAGGERRERISEIMWDNYSKTIS